MILSCDLLDVFYINAIHKETLEMDLKAILHGSVKPSADASLRWLANDIGCFPIDNYTTQLMFSYPEAIPLHFNCNTKTLICLMNRQDKVTAAWII